MSRTQTHHSKRKREFLLDEKENETRSKKGKIISLLDAVSNGNMKELKRLVKVEKLQVNCTGEFILKNGQQLKNVSPLFAAILSDQCDMIEYLLGLYPHFNLKNGIKNEDESFVFPHDTEVEIIIDSLLLIGAACFFKENIDLRKHGLMCLRQAFKLRSEHALPNSSKLLQSRISLLAFGQHEEITTTTELEEMLKMEENICHFQCLLMNQRILLKYDCGTSVYTAFCIYDFALRGWKRKQLRPTHVMYICMYLIEIIEPMKTINRKLCDLVFQELSEVFKDRRWNPKTLSKQNAVLTFENLLVILRFECSYLINAYKHRTNYQAKMLFKISEFILQILKLLMLCPKTEQQKLLLQLTLQANFRVSNVWNIPKLNLLLQVCEHFHPIDVNSKDLELTRLLLQAGTNPNVVNAEGSSPLHLLTKKESKNSIMWPHSISVNYQRRFEEFTNTVRMFFENSHHQFHDRRNLKGQLSTESFDDLQYPDPGLRHLLNETLKKVPSLACLAAVAVRNCNVGYEELPVTLQRFVDQH